MAYRVSADILYLDGTLAGMEIPAGHSVTYMSRDQAQRAAQKIERTRSLGDFNRAAVTGNRYIFISAPTVNKSERGIFLPK